MFNHSTIVAKKSRRNKQIYHLLFRSTGEDNDTDFELSDRAYPPLIFSRVKSFSADLDSCLQPWRALVHVSTEFYTYISTVGIIDIDNADVSLTADSFFGFFFLDLKLHEFLRRGGMSFCACFILNAKLLYVSWCSMFCSVYLMFFL
jgi:hypothetical protein